MRARRNVTIDPLVPAPAMEAPQITQLLSQRSGRISDAGRFITRHRYEDLVRVRTRLLEAMYGGTPRLVCLQCRRQQSSRYVSFGGGSGHAGSVRVWRLWLTEPLITPDGTEPEGRSSDGTKREEHGGLLRAFKDTEPCRAPIDDGRNPVDAG